MVRSRLSAERMGGRVARGSFQTILVNGIGAGVSFLVQLLLARRLGSEAAFGTYLLVMGWLFVGQLFGKLELDVTSVRFVGSYVATERWGLLRGFLRTCRSVIVGMSLSIAILGVPGILLFNDKLALKHPDFPAGLLVGCALLPVVTFLLFEGSVLQGLQRHLQAQLPMNLLRPIVFGSLLLLGVFVFRTRLTVPIAVGANLIGALTALVVAFSWRKRAMPPEVRAARPEFDKRTWARTGYPLFAVSLSQVVISHQADIIVVGVMLTTAQAAVYGAASQLTMPLVLAATSVTFVAQSMIADLYSRDPARLQSLIRAVSWLSAAVAIPIAIGLIVLGRPLLSLYGDGSYTSGHSILIILTLAQLVVGLIGSLAGYLLTMTSHEKEAAWIIGLSAALNLMLALVLTPRFGPIGTASATLIATIARSIALRVYIQRAMGLTLPAF